MQKEFKLYKVDIKYIRNLHNLMIPITEKQLQDIDITIHKRDRKNIKTYKALCSEELNWCRLNSEVICNKANVLYKKYMSNEFFAGKERCVDFKKLESECKRYNENK